MMIRKLVVAALLLGALSVPAEAQLYNVKLNGDVKCTNNTGGVSAGGVCTTVINNNATSRTNIGLGTTDNVSFGTGLFSKTHLSATGIGATLEGIYSTGATAPITNLTGVQGFVALETPAGVANNQSVNFFVGGVFTAEARTHNNGVGTLTLTSTASGGATAVLVASTTGVRNGDSIYVELDTGSLFSTAVNGTPSGTSIPILPALPSTATTGRKVYDYSGEVQGAIMAGQLAAGGQKYFGSVGLEASNTLMTGSSVFFKCAMCASNNYNDVVQADGPWDMMIGMSGQSGSIGAKVGIGFGPWSAVTPIQSTGTLIKTFDAATVANGVDISSYTFTNYAWKSPGASITGGGQLDATTVVSTGPLRTTASEGSQVQMSNGGQDWDINSQTAGGGGAWYLHDVTNSKFPLTISPNASVGVSVAGATVAVTNGTLTSPRLAITTPTTWANNTTCTAGQIMVDAGFIYVCTAANTVKRAALSTF